MDQKKKADGASDDAKDSKKKKGGKLPIIIALVLVLAGGGFFMMKSKGGKKEKPAVKLGEIQTMPEFLVNLRDSTVYLRAEIALQTKEGFEKEKFDKVAPAIRDAIVLKLSAKSLDEVRTVEGKDKLKRDIAQAVNAALVDPAEKLIDTEPADKGVKTKADPGHPDWDSQTGPILKVFFTSFATQ